MEMRPMVDCGTLPVWRDGLDFVERALGSVALGYGGDLVLRSKRREHCWLKNELAP